MSRVAALLVTKDSRRWIEQTLASVAGQTRPPDEIVVVDDHSTDGTPALVHDLLGPGVRIVSSTATGADRTTRIAHNFRQGVQECSSADVVVLGDHDDVWLPHRLEHQCRMLESDPRVDLVASDGRLVDEVGRRLPGTLRTAFPVPDDFNSLPPNERLRTVLRRSVATGGASALRAQAFAVDEIPAGWLHDRWWSLLAAARERLWLDDAVVIDYRVSDGQEVGLDPGHQASAPVSRLFAGAVSIGESLTRIGDLRRLPATEATRGELAVMRLLRTLA